MAPCSYGEVLNVIFEQFVSHLNSIFSTNTLRGNKAFSMRSERPLHLCSRSECPGVPVSECLFQLVFQVFESVPARPGRVVGTICNSERTRLR